MLTEPILVTLQVAEALEDLEIPYFITGSLATALHGVARATMDVDLVTELRPDKIQPLLNALGNAFFTDEQMIRNALRQGISFNLIHKETMFKVDIFPAGDRAYDHAQFERRASYTLTEESGQTAYVSSPEDNILSKLEWYRMGGEISDRQWQDVLNVLKIQKERIDRTYLEFWATQLGCSDLLARAFQQTS